MDNGRFRVIKAFRATCVEEISLRVGDIVETTDDVVGSGGKAPLRVTGVNLTADGERGVFPAYCIARESDLESLSWDSGEDLGMSESQEEEEREGKETRVAEHQRNKSVEAVEATNPRSLSRRMSIAKLKSAFSGSGKSSRGISLTRSNSAEHGRLVSYAEESPRRLAVGDRVRCVRPFAAMGLDELSLSQGEYVTLLKNSGTRWRGSNDEGDIGWFDEEIVMPAVDDPTQVQSKVKGRQVKKANSTSHMSNRAIMLDWVPEVGKVVFAVHVYTAEDLDGLSIADGDVITLIEEVSTKKWRGENQEGEIGIFDLSAVVPEGSESAFPASFGKGSVSSRGSDKSSRSSSSTTSKSSQKSRSSRSGTASIISSKSNLTRPKKSKTESKLLRKSKE